MRKLLFLLVLIPMLGMSQTKNVITVSRFFPKIDKVAEFEKALAAHAQKYHSGDWKWRVYEIQSGPDAGGFHITEGPNSWEQLDGRGTLGAEHMTDWNKNVAIYLTEKYSNTYSAFQDSLSNVALTDYSDKISITRWYPRVGYGNKLSDVIKKMKKAWMAGGESVAVYTASSSGPACYSLVTRYKQGLKERAMGFRKSFKERYEAENGDGSYADFLDTIRQYVNEQWSEILFYRADLSSK
jgi:hypothetical protein